MPPYQPPTLDGLWMIVGRDLTDPDHRVFNVSQLTDFINGGIAEVNRVKPLEDRITSGCFGESGSVYVDPGAIDEVFQVELIAPMGKNHTYVPRQRSGVAMADGWDFFAGALSFGPVWFARIEELVCRQDWSIRVWGYRPRNPLIAPNDIAEFRDLNDEQAVRLYCRLEAYRALNVDRGLFQQWQQQANNADVSPTQLAGMLGLTEQAFDRQVKRIFLPRRIPAY